MNCIQYLYLLIVYCLFHYSFILQRCGLDNRAICSIALIMSASGSIIASDWQSVKGDPCSQFSEGNTVKDTDGCQNSIQPMTVEIIPAAAVPGCGNYYPVEMELELAFDVGCEVCTPHTSLLTQINGTVGEDVYDFICLSNSSSHDLNCYWQEEDTCVNFTVSDNGSALLYNATVDAMAMNSNSSIKCSSSVTSPLEEDALVIFLSIENNSTLNCLNTTCQSNRHEYCYNPSDYGYNVTTTDLELNSCECDDASCICEAFSGPPYNCFWNPNSRITGQYCPRCEPHCRSTDHSLNFVQFIIGVCLISASWPMSRLTLSVLVSDAVGANSQVSIIPTVLAGYAALELSHAVIIQRSCII